MIEPIPNPNCSEDFDYRQDGSDWKCGCDEGLEQSPIKLPNYEAFN